MSDTEHERQERARRVRFAVGYTLSMVCLAVLSVGVSLWLMWPNKVPQ